MYVEFSLPCPWDPGVAPRKTTVAVRSADELRRAFRQARSAPLTLDGSALDRVLAVDRERGRVEVQAAARWAAFAAHPALAPFSLSALADGVGADTIAESVHVNGAGPDGAPLSRHLLAVTLVTADGELRRADRQSHPELFALAVGGQGIFGFLYSVTLDLRSLAASASARCAPLELGAGAEAGAVPEASRLELLAPPESLERFVAGVRALAAERRIALDRFSVRRTLPESDTRLRWASRAWAAVTIGFRVRRSLCAAVFAAEVRRALLALALDCGGSFPVRDLRDVSRAQLERCYPMLPLILAEKRRADPGERLQNAWLRRAQAILRG
ncbi:MAG: hypothetical protein N2653_14555 [Burkholderiales bacterium]|nr:hypothetical protein [Burkholderiales bacterium]